MYGFRITPDGKKGFEFVVSDQEVKALSTVCPAIFPAGLAD